MTKIIEITDCTQCPYLDDTWLCNYFDDYPQVPIEIIDNKSVADFCPLTNKEDYLKNE